jgi:hypothetical protein
MTLPNFLIIGDVKCGTSSLYRYLNQHPAVFMPTKLKEPRFFCYDGTEDGRIRINVKTLEEYESLFDEVTTETAIGEASPHYMVVPHAAMAIKKLIPQAKLIASLRNPVDRAHSLYLMRRREHGLFQGMTFLQALESEPRLLGGYAQHLERYYSLFPKEQIKVILFEEMVKDASGVVKDLFEFLEVDPGFTPDVSAVFNPGGVPKNKLLFKVLNNRTVRRLKTYFPSFIVKSLSGLRKANLQAVKLTPEERAEAQVRFKDVIDSTQDIIARDLSAWRAST